MNNGINKSTEEILSSLDGIKRTAAPEFFYTRLKTRMEKELMPQTRGPVFLRPVYAFAALLLVLFVNAAVILSKNNDENNSIANNENEFQSIASEYNQNDVNSVYDLTLEK